MAVPPDRLEETEGAEVHEEIRQGPDGLCTGLTIRPGPDAEPDVGATLLSGKNPAVSRERPPGRRLPQDDGREIDHIRQVGAHGETPENQVGSTRPAAAATRLVAPSAPITKSASQVVATGAQPVANDPALLFQRLLCPPHDGGDPRSRRRPRGAWRRTPSS